MALLKIAVFASLMFTGQAQRSRASPPYWPDGCRSLDVKPEVRDRPPINLDLLRGLLGGTGPPEGTIYPCVLVGEPCSSFMDCSTPPKSECYKDIQDRNRVFPGRASCIDGYCRVISNKKDSPCDCLSGCDLKDFDRDLSCINGKCQAAECAPCGEQQNNRACCAPGVRGHDGRCFCGTGAGEGCGTNPSKCNDGQFDDVCCGRGTDNEGKCCSSGSCNGQCSHQRK
ncbi:hypothetical protein FDECE_8223 [Fusarium decemcellulare]|nr:hypothetical protein FDECE_8223 [Fusarium decemcellulare]